MKVYLIAFCSFLFATHFYSVESRATEVRRVDVAEFSGDAERFYREFAQAPVIVTGVYAADPFLKSLTLADAEGYFKGRVIYGYQRKNDAAGRVREEISGEEFFKDLKQGASKYYVFDHAVSESPLAGKVSVPSFLASNWLDESYGFNLTLSGRGSFTPMHEDGSGEQAWMYLISGEKHWSIYSPKCRPVLWDSLFKNFYNPRKSDPESFPFLACAEAEKYTAIARGGDLIFLPPGWLHQVETTEDSFGLGGNIVNEFQAYESVRTSLNEKSHALRHDFDVLELLTSSDTLVETEYGHEQVRRAVELSREWLSQVRNKSDILVQRIAGTGFPGERGGAIE
jgi:hypothetical protein